MATQRIATSIIDPATGKPAAYDREILTTEISAPTTSGVRSIMSSHPTQGLTPARLAAILRQAESGIAKAQWELAEDVEEKYLHFQGVVGTRKRAVSQLDITVEAASDDKADQRNADFLREWLQRDTLEDEMFDILGAISPGVSFTETIWALSSKMWIPDRLKTRFGQWFDYDQIDGETPRLVGGPDGNASLPTDLPPFKFIVHTHPAKTGLPLRGGLIRGVAWAYLFQAMSMRDWVIFAEVYGMPIRIGKYEPNSTEGERAVLLRAVANIGTDAAAIIPQSMVIEFQNAAANGNSDIFERLVTKLDDSVSKAVLGQTGTTDSKPQGLGSGSANVHNDVRKDIQRADAKRLRATLNAQLFRPMIDLNFGPPASGVYPKVNIGQAERFTKDDLEIATGLVSLGVPIEVSVLRDRAGYPDPPETTKDGKPVKLATLPAQVAPLAGPSPETPAQAPQDDPEATDVPASAATGFLDPVKRHDGAIAPLTDPNRDAIDAATDTFGDEWQEIVSPMKAALRQVIASSSDYAEVQEKLKQLANLSPDQFVDHLTRATFAARVAGDVGFDITGGEA